MLDDDLRNGRANFGFPFDDESMKIALEETIKRGEWADPIGLPLSDVEWAAVVRYEATAEQRDKLTAYLRLFSDSAALWVSNHDLDDPAITIQLTDRFPDEELAVLPKLVPEGFDVTYATVKYSASEILALADQLGLELKGSASTTGVVDVAIELGLSPLRIEFSEELQQIALVVEAIDDDRSDQELTDLLTQQLPAGSDAKPTPGSNPVVVVRKGTQEVPANGRTDSPGQAKGGLRINMVGGGVCTSAGSVQIGVERYVLTAGHCTGTGIIHRLPSANVGTPYGSLALSSDVDGTTTTWAFDYFLSQLPADQRGIASPYVMNVSAATGVATYVKVNGSQPTGTVETTSNIVCYEGSAQNRVTYSVFPVHHFRTLCGWVIARTNHGRIQVDVKVCHGDSGGPVRNGSTMLGIVSRMTDFMLETQIPGSNPPSYACALKMSYARIGPTLDAVGGAIVTERTAMLRNEYDLCVSADNSGLANGTRYLQWGCIDIGSTPHPAQSFHLEPVFNAGHSDIYRLVRYNGTTKTCVSMDGNSAGGGYAPGALVHLWECIGSSHPLQNWQLTYFTNAIDGRFNLVSVGSGYCLSVPNSSPTPGLQLIIWGCISPPPHPAQRWRIR